MLNASDDQDLAAESKHHDLQQPLLTHTSKPITPYGKCSTFSHLTFSWLSPLIAIGHKKPLDLSDIPDLSGLDSAKGSFPILKNKLERNWLTNNTLTTFNLVTALIHTTWMDILTTAILAVVYTLASYVGPYLIDAFVQFLNGSQDSKLEGYLFVFIFFIAKVVESVSQRHWFFKLQQGGIRARAALVAMIYRKGLTISSQSKVGQLGGEITNLIAIDAERIGDFGWYIHDPWLVILQVGIALVILYLNLGLASLSALVAIAIVMLTNIPLGRLQEKFQDELMKCKDKRMIKTSEILRNMKILKLQGWEMKFLSKIGELRSVETKWLKRLLCTSTTIISIFWVAPSFIAAITFATCMLLGVPLESGKILSAIATFKILQQPIYNLPDTISMIAQTKVSLDRITAYLNLNDLDTGLVQTSPRGSSDVAVEIVNGSFSWDVLSFVQASTDQSAVDLTIPNAVGVFAFAVVQLLAVIAMMAQISWQVFLVFIPVIAICIWLQHYYISSARELARLVGICKAPIIQHFSETVSGLTTIRSFHQEQRFQDTNMKLTDGYSKPKFHSAGAREWLSLRVELMSSVVFAFFLVFLLIVPNETIDPSIAGLAVTYGLNLNILQASVIWKLCNMENSIISVERLLQYTSIPSEAPLVVETCRPNDLWPSDGKVDIHNLQVRYAPHMPLVLRGITCSFYGGTKTGIVGRTGSGKSTLIQTLFRTVEPTTGHIFIDGTNISTIGLHDLRSRLSIIPQDPTLFQGSVRSNLDPLEQYTDEQIWEALDQCQLGDEVRRKEGKLNSAVNENGENWSMGQRQLVCLGRVLLKKCKILVLDEATASVDTSTDHTIQQTLGMHFSDSTVITIAHRITSVLNGDMVLVLEQGLIEEFDSPLKLLENKSTSFAKLVAEYRGRSSSSCDYRV